MRIVYKGFLIEYEEKIDFSKLALNRVKGNTFELDNIIQPFMSVVYSWEEPEVKVCDTNQKAFSIGPVRTPEQKQLAGYIVYSMLRREYDMNPNQIFDLDAFIKEHLLDEDPFTPKQKTL